MPLFTGYLLLSLLSCHFIYTVAVLFLSYKCCTVTYGWRSFTDPSVTRIRLLTSPGGGASCWRTWSSCVVYVLNRWETNLTDWRPWPAAILYIQGKAIIDWMPWPAPILYIQGEAILDLACCHIVHTRWGYDIQGKAMIDCQNPYRAGLTSESDICRRQKLMLIRHWKSKIFIMTVYP